MTLLNRFLLAALIGFTLVGSAVPSETANVRNGREGIIAHTGSRDFYLAIPLGPGVRVEVCIERCEVLTSTDAGPSHDMLVAGRIADVDAATFEYLCRCPASQGLAEGSWRLAGIGPRITLPPTDTDGAP
jgi:hypothetical protein